MYSGARDGLKADLEYWSNLNDESFRIYFDCENNTRLAKGSTEILSFDYFRDSVEKANRASKVFLDEFASIVFSIKNIESFEEKIFAATSSLKNYLSASELINAPSLNLFMIGFLSLLIGPITKVTAISEIDIDFALDPQERQTLNNYLERGISIHNDPEYYISPIGMLEEFVSGQIKTLKAYKERIRLGIGNPIDAQLLQEMSSFRKYFGPYAIKSENDFFEKLFYAIVAPSMEGKTQSAFVFRKVYPLYFLLLESSLEATTVSQDIYKIFRRLSNKFRSIATFDFLRFKELSENEDISASGYDLVAAETLASDHGDFKFLSLGFLVALIDQANENFESSGKCWMDFFATSPKKFSVKAMSINEVRRRELGNYILFFDEFAALDWTVFVRNLARAALIPLFVANTNTCAVNLVGRKRSASSRIDMDFAWSLVSIRLNNLGENLLRNIKENLTDKINHLANAAGKEKNLIIRFFEDFKNNQLKNLRPGFAELIVKHINNITVPESRALTLNEILREIVKPLGAELLDKKPEMKKNHEAILGTFALFMNNAYSTEDSTELGHIFHRKTYLKDHFYYLANPVDNTKWAFLTYPPEAMPVRASTPATISPCASFRPLSLTNQLLRVITDPESSDSKFSDWNMEYTYFNSKEIIPMFACLNIINEGSIVGHLRRGIDKINASPLGTGDTQNMAQAVPLSGNLLEVLSTVCIIESSQHKIGESSSTFCGQDGKSFLTNLVENLIEADGFRRTNKVVVKYHKRTFGPILGRMHVPYLFPSEMDLPKLFKENLSDAKGFNSRSVHFGEYRRTTNSQEIDAIFNYFIKNEQDNPPTVATCAIEYKNWSQNLSLEHLKSIIKKAVKKSANLSLVFCNTLSSAHNTVNVFKQECNENKWNVLKLKKADTSEIGKKNFELVRYFPDLNITLEPCFSCIVLELATIESRSVL